MTENSHHNVVVMGASNKPDRYSNKAIRLLKQHGYHVIPIHPNLAEIENIAVVDRIDEIQERVDTLTMYLNPVKSVLYADSIIALNPGRMIFNPGSESAELEERLRKSHIPLIKACTLVLLRSGRF